MRRCARRRRQIFEDSSPTSVNFGTCSASASVAGARARARAPSPPSPQSASASAAAPLALRVHAADARAAPRDVARVARRARSTAQRRGARHRREIWGISEKETLAAGAENFWTSSLRGAQFELRTEEVA